MEKDEKKTTSGRELLSLIREAFAFNYAIRLTANSLSENTSILFFEDNDVRDRGAERTMGIRASIELVQQVEATKELSLELFFDRLKLILQCNLISISGNILVVSVPKEGITKNVRTCRSGA